MADIVRKQAVSVEGPSIRERLQAMDDSAVVTAFLGGEERAPAGAHDGTGTGIGAGETPPLFKLINPGETVNDC